MWSLFNPSQYPRLIGCHPFSPTNHLLIENHRSLIQIMHHPVSRINFLIHSVSFASHVSTRLLIHLSAHLCRHHHSYHPSLLHSFTRGSKPTFSTNPSHLNTSSTSGLSSRSWERTGLIMLLYLFLVCFFSLVFLFLPCGGLSWLHVSFFLHVKCTISYRIV